MAWGKKEDKTKIVKMKADPKQAKQMRKDAVEAARQAGKEVKVTKKGVGTPARETARQRSDRENRERINKLSAQGQREDPQWQGVPPAGKKGSKGGRWD